MMNKLIYASICGKGKRPQNEDSFAIIDHQAKGRWMGVVCDGMGGHSQGDVASRLVVDAISEFWELESSEHDSEEKIRRMCKFTFERFEQKVKDLHHTQMGTTLAMASIENNKLTIAHLGDSRCYVLDKDGKLAHVTQDHVAMQDGMEKITKCFFSDHPEVITPEVTQLELKEDTTILICSDGVHRYIPAVTVKRFITKECSPQESLTLLGDYCCKISRDNYTAILLKVLPDNVG